MSWIRWEISSLTLQEIQAGWLQGRFLLSTQSWQNSGLVSPWVSWLSSQGYKMAAVVAVFRSSHNLVERKKKELYPLSHSLSGKKTFLEALQQTYLYTLLARKGCLLTPPPILTPPWFISGGRKKGSLPWPPLLKVLWCSVPGGSREISSGGNQWCLHHSSQEHD